MGDVDPMQIRKWLLPMALIPSILSPSQVAQEIETMDLVEDIQLCDIGIRSQSIFLWVLDSELRVLSKFSNIVGGDWECSDGVEFFPCCVYLWVWLFRIPKPIRIRRFEKTVVRFYDGNCYVYFVKDRSCENI